MHKNYRYLFENSSVFNTCFWKLHFWAVEIIHDSMGVEKADDVTATPSAGLEEGKKVICDSSAVAPVVSLRVSLHKTCSKNKKTDQDYQSDHRHVPVSEPFAPVD